MCKECPAPEVPRRVCAEFPVIRCVFLSVRPQHRPENTPRVCGAHEARMAGTCSRTANGCLTTGSQVHDHELDVVGTRQEINKQKKSSSLMKYCGRSTHDVVAAALAIPSGHSCSLRPANVTPPLQPGGLSA